MTLKKIFGLNFAYNVYITSLLLIETLNIILQYHSLTYLNKFEIGRICKLWALSLLLCEIQTRLYVFINSTINPVLTVKKSQPNNFNAELNFKILLYFALLIKRHTFIYDGRVSHTATNDW